ncbi:MAG TPA: hypothetical protein VMU80_07610 [Bryobacteraceae bacterium]|nr:hypothetical protein [Bryobacteraceae bacterium]
MKFRCLAAVFVLGLPLCAAAGYTVEQIKSFIESAIQLKNPDKEVAQTLRSMKLSERLDLDLVEKLQGEGAGPKTVAALKELATESASLPVAAPPPPKVVYVPPPPPPADEQAKLLDEVRDYAINYTHTLPDFICLEQTRRYIDTTGRDNWRLADIMSARLTYFNQKEDYKLISLNDQLVTDKSYTQAGGALSTGDFGTTMREIFQAASRTHFEWLRWGKLRGRIAHVYQYRVPLEFSQWSIEYQGENKDDTQRILAGYHGLIFVDKELHTIVRITQEAENLPPTFPVQAAKETMDYDFTKIGDSEFFLPLVDDLRMHSGRLWNKNIKEFRLYRKFSADSVIKFDDKDLPPLPDDKTKEEPQPQPPPHQ